MSSKILDISFIVLSGGKSSRMGFDKGMALINNRPMIAYILENINEITENIIISANNNDYKKFNYSIVKDEFKDIGPIGGIYSALKHSKTNRNFVVGCDIPLVELKLLEHIILNWEDGLDVVVPEFNGKLEPLCSLYSKNILPKIEKAIQEKNYKLIDMILSSRHKLVHLEKNAKFDPEISFLNVNHKKELNAIREIISK